MERIQWAGAISLLFLAVGAGAWYARSSPEPPLMVVSPPPTTDIADIITVHVSGAVAFPGLVELPAGMRIADAVAAAGGALPDADLSALNLAAVVVDGQQLVVTDGGADGIRGAASGGRIGLNTADVGELQRLPGVGPVLAERILRHREENGPFGSVEDLLDVPGIGEVKLEALRDSVAVP